MADLSVTETMAFNVLDQLAKEGACIAEFIESTRTIRYILPGLKKRREIKCCEYCGAQYDHSQIGYVCLRCGGSLIHKISS